MSATDKANNKVNKITISNSRGRLSPEEINLLIKESERFKTEDEIIKKKIESKNSLENYLYSVKNSLKDEKFKDKLQGNEKENIQKLVDEATRWIESQENAQAEEFANKQKKIEEVFNPIMMRIYQQTGGAPSSDNFSAAPSSEGRSSNVDEVD